MTVIQLTFNLGDIVASITKLVLTIIYISGGGRIKHDPVSKVLHVYGHSYGFGRADHTKTVEVLQTVYTDYNITWSNEGY